MYFYIIIIIIIIILQGKQHSPFVFYLVTVTPAKWYCTTSPYSLHMFKTEHPHAYKVKKSF